MRYNGLVSPTGEMQQMMWDCFYYWKVHSPDVNSRHQGLKEKTIGVLWPNRIPGKIISFTKI